jgi:hypothetical protein
MYIGVKLYNSLPTYIKTEINNPRRFELLLKKFLLENSFYSLKEFYNWDKGLTLSLLFFYLIDLVPNLLISMDVLN